MVVIKNGRVMDPKTGLDQVCDLRIEGKKMCIRDRTCVIAKTSKQQSKNL